MKKKTRRYYALPCMIAIALVAVVVAGGGFVLRRTLLKGLPQYDGAPDIAIPMMLLHDSGPLREARARAEWEAEERMAALSATQVPTPLPATKRPTRRPTASPTPAPTDAPTLVPAAAATAVPMDAPTAEPTLEPTPTPVPERFFDHTLFIGDSRTDGMRMWGRLGRAEYFCGTNYTVYNIFDKVSSDKNFRRVKLSKLLSKHKYDQIYIILGYNECGYPFESLMDQFRYVIARVHKAQPRARLILHGVMHASARTAARYAYYAVENIEKVNDSLRRMAEENEGLYFVDCNEPFCGEDGFLLPDVSADGEHLTPEYTAQWAQEIRLRAITD